MGVTMNQSTKGRTKFLSTSLILLFLLAWAFSVPAAGTDDCEVIDFDQFTHSDSITQLSLFGGSLTLDVAAFRNLPADNVDPTAYHTDYGPVPPGEGVCTNLLNSTHEDTQIPASVGLEPGLTGFCVDCDGIIMQVPDVDFCQASDDSQGGTITFTGFPSDGLFEIPSFAAVDTDNFNVRIILRVGGGLTFVGESSGAGDGTVEIVQTIDHIFNEMMQFELLGSGGIDDIEVCRLQPPKPGIDIEKATNGVDADDPNAGDAPQVATGNTVNWTYKVTNTGDVRLDPVVVTDDQGVPVSCPLTALDPAQMMTCTASGPAEDLLNTPFTTVPGLCGGFPNTPLYENKGKATVRRTLAILSKTKIRATTATRRSRVNRYREDDRCGYQLEPDRSRLRQRGRSERCRGADRDAGRQHADLDLPGDQHGQRAPDDSAGRDIAVIRTAWRCAEPLTASRSRVDGDDDPLPGRDVVLRLRRALRST